VLHNTWDEALETLRDIEAKAQIQGVQSQMIKFDFLFGVIFGEMILRRNSNLSKALQAKVISAAEGQQTANMVALVSHGQTVFFPFVFCWVKMGLVTPP